MEIDDIEEYIDDIEENTYDTEEDSLTDISFLDDFEYSFEFEKRRISLFLYNLDENEIEIERSGVKEISKIMAFMMIIIFFGGILFGMGISVLTISYIGNK